MMACKEAHGETPAMKTKIMFLVVGAVLLPVFECWSFSVVVRWAPNSESDLAGYKVYYGTDTRIYGTIVDAGKTTSHQIDGLREDVTYYFTVTAYNSEGYESYYSEEVSFLEPGAGGGGGGNGSGGGGEGSTTSSGGGGGGGACFIEVCRTRT
jgi:uncharacterized membrane protein YgcG